MSMKDVSVPRLTAIFVLATLETETEHKTHKVTANLSVSSCRNCELRNALEYGDAATVARAGAHGGTRICDNGHVRAGRAHKRSGEVFSDVSSDRSSRRQGTVGPQGRHTRDTPEDVSG